VKRKQTCVHACMWSRADHEHVGCCAHSRDASSIIRRSTPTWEKKSRQAARQVGRHDHRTNQRNIEYIAAPRPGKPNTYDDDRAAMITDARGRSAFCNGRRRPTSIALALGSSYLHHHACVSPCSSRCMDATTLYDGWMVARQLHCIARGGSKGGLGGLQPPMSLICLLNKC
jgi:hypothetical protein